jgi:hypothetical protein
MKVSGHGLECEMRFSPPDNEGWMRVDTQIRVPAFEGSYACTVQIDEWRDLIQALRKLETMVGRDTEVSWGNMEANIEFKFRLHKRGTLEGQYRFSPENFSLGPTLSGAFEADRTFLRGWARSAQQVLENVR